MNGLTKTSAVHLRIEDDQKESKQSKEDLKTECSKGHGLSPDSSNKCDTYNGFQQGERLSKMFGYAA